MQWRFANCALLELGKTRLFPPSRLRPAGQTQSSIGGGRLPRMLFKYCMHHGCASVVADMATAHTAAAVTAAGAPIEPTAPASAGMASSRAPTSPVSAARGEQIENENTSFCTDCAFLISPTHAPHNRYAGVNALNAAAKYLARGSRVVVVDRNGKWGGQWVGQYEYVH